VIAGQTPKAVATAFGVCVKTVNKWVARFQAEGAVGLIDRSSRPHRLYRPTPATTSERIAELRRQRATGKQIAQQVGVSPATVSRVLARLGLNKLSALEPAAPIVRYEREHPGDMIHSTSKSLVASTASAIASPATAPARATTAASAGNSFTSALMMPRASLSRRSCPMRRKRAPSPS
jgi:hypothetical protein